MRDAYCVTDASGGTYSRCVSGGWTTKCKNVKLCFGESRCVMTKPMTFDPARLVLFHPNCPECGAMMWLTEIEPDEPGYDLRTFECAPCDVRTTQKVKYSRAG